MEKLAIFGGTPVIDKEPDELFAWPIMGQEDYDAAMDVVKNNNFSGTDITEKFQEEFAAWQGTKYAIAYCNGTASLTAAMFAIGLGKGDEIICTTKTYWGSVSQAINFGAVPVFCNIDETLCMDPNDIERCITPKTKAIMVVHYYSCPCDMDKIMAIAEKYNLYVIEDVSHAHGAQYKGKKVGSFGHVAAMSMMSWKSFAAGELGMLVTSDTKIYERAMAFGHYERNNENYIKESEDLKPYYHVALGGIKGRANQVCTALGRIQLKYYDERTAEIRKAMNYFWDLLDDLPGVHGIRVNEAEGSHMGGCYYPHAIYKAEELHGLSVSRFCEAVRAEGYGLCWDGGNYALHTHAFFKTFDLTHSGTPSRIENCDRDVRLEDAECDRCMSINCILMPWFKHFDKEWIEKYAQAFRKVVENHEQLLEADEHKAQGGRWYGATNQ